MDITKDFQALLNGQGEDSQISEEIYRFCAAMDDACNKGPVVYRKDRARRGGRDGKKTDRRAKVGRNIQGDITCYWGE